MKMTETGIEGLFVVEPDVFRDARGYFLETFSQKAFDECCRRTFGKESGCVFVQDNESMSSYGVVRGLHYQKGIHSQAKLVRVISGEVLDVAVDLRRDSPTFGRYFKTLLTGENKRQLFIPRGFAHGFAVISETAVFQYKCDNYYCPSSEAGIAWNDPDIAVDWEIPAGDVILSAKDTAQPMLADVNPDDLF